MLHPGKEILRRKSHATKKFLRDSIERMKESKTTGCIVVHLPEGDYTIAFLQGTLVTVLGPLSTDLEILLERADCGDISAFTVDEKVFGSYIGYLEKRSPQKTDGMPLNTVLVELVNRKHTGTIEVTTSEGEGLIFLVDGIPETACYSDEGRTMASTEALDSIMKMAVSTTSEIKLYSAVKSTDSLGKGIPISEMKMRGFFFNVLRSHIREEKDEKAVSVFDRRMGRSGYFDLIMYPLEEFLRASDTAEELLGMTDFELGKMVYPDFKKSVLGRLVFFLGNADTPSKLARIAQAAWSVSTNYGERWIEEDTEGRIVLRVKNDGDTCERLKGILAGAMECIGYECTVSETECEKRGGRFCEFVVEWDPRSR
ncbi:MAG: TIGR02265 family protein [Theionarchaea archaeon]|nr:TIGR02265 family protein [Theionarchaea archaeon]MBU7038479.1 TIGR02265 family protein [Theionarchaea archaeon]